MTTTETKTAKFEEGKTYFKTWEEETGRPHMLRYTIKKRTAKTVVFGGQRSKISYCEWANCEIAKICYGMYLYAKDICDEAAEAKQNATDKAWDEMEADADRRYREVKAAKAEREEIMSTPLTTAEAIEIATNAEIELANAEDNSEVAKVVITAKEDANERPIAYYVDSKKTRKANIEFYYANNPAYNGIIEIDYQIARYQFPNLYKNGWKVIFTDWAETGMTVVTKAAAKELGLNIVRPVSFRPAIYLVAENTEADPADYAISADAFEVAVNAEIANAADNNISDTKESPKMTNREKFLAVMEKYGILDRRATNNSRLWYIDGKRTGKAKIVEILNGYGLTFEEFVTEHNSWLNVTISATLAQMAIDDQADFISDKHNREINPCDDNAKVFDLLPNLDDLNDVEDELIATPEVENKENAAPVDEFSAKLAELKANYDAAKITVNNADAELFKAREVVEEKREKAIAAEEAEFKAKCAYHNYLREVAEDLTAKLLTPEILDAKLFLTSQNGTKFEHEKSLFALRVKDGYKAPFEIAMGFLVFGGYETPAQIEKVIGMLKETVARGEKEFKFPTIDELNAPPPKQNSISDSLARAMKIALEECQKFCLENNLPAAQNELNLFSICSEALETHHQQATLQAQCDSVNETAPEGWQVSPCADNPDKYQISFNGQNVTTIDSLILAKILPPDKFFGQFQSLADKNFSPQNRFLDDWNPPLNLIETKENGDYVIWF